MSRSEIAPSIPQADTVFMNGKIVTVNSNDDVTEALSIRRNRILRVGDRAYVEKTVGPDTKVVNLNGRTLVPGFIENHIHMTNSPQRLWADCSYAVCPSISDIVEKIANREGMGWTFNTCGLRRIGVEDHTPDPPGGPMERDHEGRPLGPMCDNTREVFIKPNLPKYRVEDLLEGYRWIAGELNRS